MTNDVKTLSKSDVDVLSEVIKAAVLVRNAAISGSSSCVSICFSDGVSGSRKSVVDGAPVCNRSNCSNVSDSRAVGDEMR